MKQDYHETNWHNPNCEGVWSELEFVDHGYEDLLITISPDIPANQADTIIGKERNTY